MIRLHAESLDMDFDDFANVYLDYIKTRIKDSSYEVKRRIIENNVSPFFKGVSVSAIDVRMVHAFQNDLLERYDKESTYLHSIQEHFSCILNHAVTAYGLKTNPMKIVGYVGSIKRKKPYTVWTKEQFMYAVEFEDKEMYRVLWWVLFFSGLRIGEALALTRSDIVERNGGLCIHVTKTYNRIHKKDVITTPKTSSSDRFVDIPEYIVKMIDAYLEHVYSYNPMKDRIFTVQNASASRKLHKLAKAADLPNIHLHDLRHSHATMLIYRGVPITAISARLGHSNVRITMETYAHAYKSDGATIANDLQQSIMKSMLKPVKEEMSVICLS